MSNKLMIFGSNTKNGGIPLFGGKKLCLKRIGVHHTWKEGGGSRHSFAK